MSQLLQHVERTREGVGDGPAAPTNSAAEQSIGPSVEVRAKTMEGLRSVRKVLVRPYLVNFLGGEDGVWDLRQVIRRTPPN